MRYFMLLFCLALGVTACREGAGNTISSTENRKQKSSITEKPAVEILNYEDIKPDFGYTVHVEETDSIDIPVPFESIKDIVRANINTNTRIEDLMFALEKAPKDMSKLPLMEALFTVFEGSNVYPKKLFRRVEENLLEVQLDNGNKLEFQNGTDSILGEVAYSFSYLDPHLNCFVIDKSFGDGGVHKLYVHKGSGQITECWGTAILKNNNRFATVSKTGICSDNANGFQVFSAKNGEIHLELQVVLGEYNPENIAWVSDNQLILECTDDAENHFYYRFSFEKAY